MTDADLIASSRSRALTRLRAAMALAVVVPLAALVVAAALLYRQAFDNARQDLDSATRIAQEHAQKMLETNEMLLERMLDLFGDGTDAELLARGAELHERMKAMTRDLPQVQGFFSIGANGRMLATNRAYPPPRHIDFSDRDFLAAHRSGTGPRVHITGHLVSRVTGEAFFDMSRRRVRADGSYAGTVNIALYPDYLTRFWGDIGTTMPGLVALLVHANGKLIARHPGGVPGAAALAPEHPMMRQIAAGSTRGSFEVVSPFDQRPRLGEFRKIGDYPVYIAMGFDRSTVLGAWLRRAAWLALFAIPLSLALAWAAWVAIRRTRSEFDAAERLEAESQRRRNAELALVEAQKLEALGRLAGGVAHDFNNLLMIVQSSAFLIRRDPRHAGQALDAVDRAVGSGSRLTRQLLALSGRQALAPERVVLQERLPALTALARAALPASVELAVQVDPGTEPIFVDPAELEIALVNLAVNARDAMETGGRLDISARNALPGEAMEGEGRYVVVEVADTGSGIDEALIDQVVEPFFTTKAAGHGTGLGLTQVKALVESGGGRMRIDNRPGGGARVRLYFRPAGSAAASPRGTAPAPVRELGLSVLLVEDNRDVAQTTGAVLESLGCAVRHAANAAEALKAMGEAGFDVVLSDIEMPGGMDGIALASRIAARAPVVLMSGYTSRIERARSLGLTVLAKPCSAVALRDALAKVSRSAIV